MSVAPRMPEQVNERPLTKEERIQEAHARAAAGTLRPEDWPYFLPQVELIDNDGEPLESDWHRLQINLLVDSIEQAYAGRNDYYASGNMFIYFNEEQARTRDFRGPDFFFVKDVNRDPIRLYWVGWKESRYPDVVIELMSPTTRNEDLTIKKKIYEQNMHVTEYYCYDPDTHELFGWLLVGGKYEPLAPNAQGRLHSVSLNMDLGIWEGEHFNRWLTWLRFFHPSGELVFNTPEAQKMRAESEGKRAEAEHQRAEAERQRAEAERQRAEAERQRAEAERQRANALEAELVRLKAQLDSHTHGTPT
jgi:Uma2 family endonuclease